MYTREEICAVCGDNFLYRSYQRTRPTDGALGPVCPDCLAAARKREENEREQREREARQKKAEEDHEKFLVLLKTWDTVAIGDIRPASDNVLYVLGNGFDLMHRVPSSYYHFRDSMGKNSILRSTLENFITVEDLWADFENALAHFDIGAMTHESLVDMWLDSFGAYEEDSGAAEYYMSVETAANPIATVANELPGRFRKWVNTLKIGTADRPLRGLFASGKALTFNYTEFVEELYGIPKENVCYIHGCRVKQKGKQPEPLILGHLAGASDEAFDTGTHKKSRLRGYRRAFVEMAQGSVIDYIIMCDESLTKDTEKIIRNHKQFFSDLSGTDTVITIGHSFSDTDLDYFSQIKESIADIKSVKWYFGCYGLRDLVNLGVLSDKLGIKKSEVKIFRTDTVVTTPLPVPEKGKAKPRVVVKPLCTSGDGKWIAERIRNYLYINAAADGETDYSVTVPKGIKRAFFTGDDRLLVVTHGDPAVLLLRNTGGHWRFIGEFHCDHQGLLVQRLRRVFATESEITFVYNNRIRKYSLADCSVIYNGKALGARNRNYDGDDITHLFIGK